MQKKWCPGCKSDLSVEMFARNRSRKDGLQNHCKACSKGNWGKDMACAQCGAEFRLSHRNVSKRKTRLCAHCAIEVGRQKVIARNKAGATYVTYSTKGYRYVFDHARGKYMLEQRIVMEHALGRPLDSAEVVHHINNVKTDNSIENLFLTSNAGHSLCHRSLIPAAWDAVLKGYIVFDRHTGKYRSK